MFGIGELIKKTILKEELTEEEKIKLLYSKRIDIKVVKYLSEKLNNLYIEVLGDYKGSLFELMSSSKLMGWCWQTTESAIIFLNDDDYIERGYLYFDEETPKYYHSWICFNYNEVEYVLDPCLNYLCRKKDYSKMFKTDVLGKVSAKDVKEELIRQITTKKEVDLGDYKNFEECMKIILGESYEKYKEEKKNEVTVHGPEDINTPLYRNGAGYTAELENGNIKKLKVHYYYIDF